MSLNELIKKYLAKTGYLENDKILAVVAYGSRVTGNYKKSSDLDVLVITSMNANNKAGMVVDGIKVESNIFSVYDIFDIAYQKRIANNAYFNSIMKFGNVIKDNGILEEFKEYLQEISSIKVKKKKLSFKSLIELKELYDNFISTKASYWYFNLLEKLRMSYNYLKNCSYINMVKVYDVFSNKDFYEDAYSVKLPDERFISLFLEGSTLNDYELQLDVIEALINVLGINLDKEIDCNIDEEIFLNDNDIKNELLVIYNKVEKVIEYLKEDHPYSIYSYNVLLRHMDLFYQKVYKTNSKEIDVAIKNANSLSNEERIKVLKELFGIVEVDYHFDYDNYMLKLKL